MRGAFVVLALATGCGFELPGGVGADATPGSDAPADVAADSADVDAPPADAAVDAPNACLVGLASTTGTDRGRVGANGGGDNFPALACTGTDRIVGVAVRVSNQNTIYNGRSIHGFQILCATVTIQPAGPATVGTVTPVEVMGNGGFSWSPSTLSQPTMCPAGSIVSGLLAHSGDDENRLLDVTMTCTQITLAGATGASQTIHVDGSLTETDNPYQRNCNANEVLVRLPNRTGAGIDSLNLSCTTPLCM